MIRAKMMQLAMTSPKHDNKKIKYGLLYIEFWYNDVRQISKS